MSTKNAPVVVDETAVDVFTDGSSLPGPRRGGIGYRVVTVDDNGDEVIHDEQPPGYLSGTNQEMELMACVEALRLLSGRHSPVDLDRFTKIVIHTDSAYVANNFVTAKFTWPQNKWHTLDGNPIVNAELWKQFTAASRKIQKRVEIVWHQGRSATNPHNKAADKLAKQSARGALQQPVNIARVRRKYSDKSTEAGSIKAEGQRLTISD